MNSNEAIKLEKKLNRFNHLMAATAKASLFDKDKPFSLFFCSNGEVRIAFSSERQSEIRFDIEDEQSKSFLRSVVGSLVNQQIDSFKKETEQL